MREILPKRWTQTQIENIIVSLESGGRPKGGVKGILQGIPSIGGEHLNDIGGFKVHNTRYIPESYYKSLRKGHIGLNDILIVKDGATTGKTSFVDASFPFEIAVVNEHVFVLKIHNQINPKAIFFFLLSQEGNRRILENFQGSAQGGINRQFISNTLVPLPPLPEQKRIVAKLDKIMPRIDKVKERLEKIPTTIKRFRQSVLTDAVTGKLTEKWREEYPEVESTEVLLEKIKDFRIKNAANQRELNAVKKNYAKGEIRLKDKEHSYDLPETWKYCEIDTIGNVYNGSTPSRKISKYWKGDICWVSSGEVANTRIAKTRERITKAGFDNSSVKLFPKGTVLIAMIGEGKTRGQTAILDTESTCNQNVAAVLVNHGYIISEYLFNWFYMQYQRNRSLGSGSGPKALNCQRVREIDFILPPLEEQKEIVRQVDKLFALADKLEEHYRKAKTKVDKLTQSVLAKAFRGELVPQDPNDEPAEKLLERIQKEKAKMEAGLKKSRRKTKKANKK